MPKTKDPEIKLFGKTIQLPKNEEKVTFSCNRNEAASTNTTTTANEDCPSSISHSKDESKEAGEDEQIEEAEKDPLGKRLGETNDKDSELPPIPEEATNPPTLPWNSDNPTTPSFDKETATSKSSRTEEQQSETSNSQEKTILKKPDKKLPCPRCKSVETKFCYYNNYNVKQPRHYCKNCQRHWTDGGTMRNVPVGAGRSKNKNSTSNYRHIIVRETLETVRPIDTPDGFHPPILKPNGVILTYGSDPPLYESMASALNLTDRTMPNRPGNGFHGSEERRISSVSCGGLDNVDGNSNRLPITASNSAEKSRIAIQEQIIKRNFHGFSQHIPYIPGPPLPYPWNSAVTPPALSPQNIPMPFYPATTYWNCPVPGSWSIPWTFPPSTSPNLVAPPNNPTSSPNPQTLGKHSREGKIMFKPSISEKEDPTKQGNSDRVIWIPKTLRIDDPDEAARSSIWSTLGIKNDKTDSISGRSLFNSKGDENYQTSETSQVLQANPAALSRSLKFNEMS